MTTFHGDKVSMAELRGRLIAGVRAADDLRAVKLALFNAEGPDIGMTASTAAVLALSAPNLIAGRHPTNKQLDDAELILCNALGIFVESGAFLSMLLATLESGQGFDGPKALAKMGGLGAHADNLLTALGYNSEDVEADDNQLELLPVHEIGKAEPVRYVPREPLKLTAPDTVGSCQTANQCPTPVACASGTKACHLAG